MNSQVNITFDHGVPDAVRENVTERLSRWIWLLPPWVQTLHIVWQEDGKEDRWVVSNTTSYAYRRICLHFYPAWIARDTDQDDCLVHDLLHTFSCVLADYARETIGALVPESEAPKFRESLLRELTCRHEAWTQDLAFVLVRRLSGRETK